MSDTNTIVNKYEIQLGPVDTLGAKYLQNLIRFIQKGAKIKEGTFPTCTFPHRAWLTLDTEELIEREPGVEVFVLSETFTREQLDDMDWETFRKSCRNRGVKGKDRAVMTRAYLAATGQDPHAIAKSKLTPKGGKVEEDTTETTSVEVKVAEKPKRQQKKQEGVLQEQSVEEEASVTESPDEEKKEESLVEEVKE